MKFNKVSGFKKLCFFTEVGSIIHQPTVENNVYDLNYWMKDCLRSLNRFLFIVIRINLRSTLITNDTIKFIWKHEFKDRQYSYQIPEYHLYLQILPERRHCVHYTLENS